MRTPMTVLLTLAFVALGGCVKDTANDGDCNIAIRFEGSIFRVNSDMRQRAPLGESLGTGELVGCGGMDAEAIGEVELRQIKGVSPSDAVAVSDGEGKGLYIRTDLVSDRASWPEVLDP